MTRSRRVMAIDFGSRRLGVAVSDPTGLVAQPLTVIVRTDPVADIEAISKLIDDLQVARIVIGNPITLAGQEGRQSAIVREFAGDVEAAIDLPVDVYDERLSSKEARRRLQETGGDRRKDKGRIDQIAAALFLQSYLDGQARRAAK